MVKLESESKKSIKMDETKKVAKKRKSLEEEPVVKPVEKKQKVKEEEEIKAEKRKKSFSKDDGNKKSSFKKDGKKPYSGSDAKAMAAASDKPQLSQKELKVERRKKKLSTTYQISVDIKKIWETLRK
jgi:hypothetical protein